jgi:hypothetical protein
LGGGGKNKLSENIYEDEPERVFSPKTNKTKSLFKINPSGKTIDKIPPNSEMDISEKVFRRIGHAAKSLKKMCC